jgi:hypothetical protein
MEVFGADQKYTFFPLLWDFKHKRERVKEELEVRRESINHHILWFEKIHKIRKKKLKHEITQKTKFIND